jgi:hypothetical protein
MTRKYATNLPRRADMVPSPRPRHRRADAGKEDDPQWQHADAGRSSTTTRRAAAARSRERALKLSPRHRDWTGYSIGGNGATCDELKTSLRSSSVSRHRPELQLPRLRRRDAQGRRGHHLHPELHPGYFEGGSARPSGVLVAGARVWCRGSPGRSSAARAGRRLLAHILVGKYCDHVPLRCIGNPASMRVRASNSIWPIAWSKPLPTTS